MKEQDFPKLNPTHYPLPKDFFVQQDKEISAKTAILENFKIKVSEKPETLFPHSTGTWLNMEYAIQNRVHTSASPQVQQNRSPLLVWVAATFAMIGIFFGSFFFIQNRNATTADWAALMEEIPESEAMAYLIDSQSEYKETIEQMAGISFRQNDEAAFQLSIPTSEIEQVLNESTDLEEYLN